MIYTASITSASLRLRESRIVADLLLKGVSDTEWKEAIFAQNILQTRSSRSARNLSSLLRARLEPMGAELWGFVRDGGRELATQAAFAGTVRDSRILGDFLDLALREQRVLFARHLGPHLWQDYIAGCRGRDPDIRVHHGTSSNDVAHERHEVRARGIRYVPHPESTEPFGIENLDRNNDDRLGGPASTLASALDAANQGLIDLDHARQGLPLGAYHSHPEPLKHGPCHAVPDAKRPFQGLR